MCAELLEWALKQPQWAEQLAEAKETVGAVPAKPDPRGVDPRQQYRDYEEHTRREMQTDGGLSKDEQIEGNPFSSEHEMEKLEKAARLMEAMEMMELMEKMKKAKGQ